MCEVCAVSICVCVHIASMCVSARLCVCIHVSTCVCVCVQVCSTWSSSKVCTLNLTLTFLMNCPLGHQIHKYKHFESFNNLHNYHHNMLSCTRSLVHWLSHYKHGQRQKLSNGGLGTRLSCHVSVCGVLTVKTGLEERIYQRRLADTSLSCVVKTHSNVHTCIL